MTEEQANEVMGMILDLEEHYTAWSVREENLLLKSLYDLHKLRDAQLYFEVMLATHKRPRPTPMK